MSWMQWQILCVWPVIRHVTDFTLCYLFIKNEIVYKYANKIFLKNIQDYKNTCTRRQYKNTIIQVCLSVAKNNTIVH